MVDTTLAGLVVNVEVLEVVVEVDTARAEVTAQKRRMGSENSRHIDVAFPAQGYGYTSLPFVEMGYHDLVELSGDVLEPD